MGIIKAALSSIGGALADQWLEIIEPDEMSDTTVFAEGKKARSDSKRNSNKNGTEDIITDGSIIRVYPNQFMILTDGGKVIDYTAEEGYYKVQNASAPSLFNGNFGDSLKESFSRVKFSGVPSGTQQVFYINLQEIKGIKFGTRMPVNYFDSFYNAELFLRAHGTYSIKIIDPLLFFMEAIPRNKNRVDINDINDQYLNEFLEALQSAINQMSADGVRISFVASKGRELSKYMSTILDDDWKAQRGMEIQSVGIASISYDEESTKLINMRNQGAMLSDPSIREGYVQGAVARGIEAAGSNANGSMAGFMGVGMGMNSTGSFMNAASASNTRQMEQMREANAANANNTAKPAGEWKCACGAVNTGKFCTECGAQKPADEWKCSCGAINTGKFCSECGSKRPENRKVKCDKCGYEPDMSKPIPKFCPECGDKINEEDYQ